MSKKHFVAMAAEIRRMLAEMDRMGDSADRIDGARQMALGVSDVCARFNVNFDRDRFLTACGLTEAN